MISKLKLYTSFTLRRRQRQEKRHKRRRTSWFILPASC